MIIDGRKIAKEILEQLKTEVASLGFKPKLIDVFVGSDPVIESYVNIKAKRAFETGIDFEIKKYPQDVLEETLVADIKQMNSEKNICGLIVQLPLPKHLDKQAVMNAINPDIDVDMITSVSLGELFTGQQKIMPATASAILRMLKDLNIDLRGKHVLVVGAGDLVGKPVTFLLMQAGATVTVANQSTQDLSSLCLSADIIISGTGVPGLIKPSMVRAESIVIDAGTAESNSGISGDVDFERIKDKVFAVSPVPGGVGPVTVAMLLSNVVAVAKRRM
ncbi:MAG: methylenetetrahydrofolate dehydrogenase (NADP+) / methenyltetrahydrofolate cyclohydrolase [Candidatus Doudnabacteria bacterium Gr01-1014_77]|uniref:Bifunctional protein FolD n=1 Tax=Candidatus Doudnabacteria bacterium Gr01-1014_77 TaxID=2017133 RepID=A0A554JB37_9BACT|nr:MAG: methylenetetrahydrofolate dehydrogenase (NADP+) / methenyltetrahydrofolate cyclohydrolase [Candidatus Doudnabacteria bacterium Gr01-1014_77]